MAVLVPFEARILFLGKNSDTSSDGHALPQQASSGAPDFRFTQPRRLLAPDGTRMGLVEKGWPPLSHNGSLYFMIGMNPPYVVRAPDTVGDGSDIVTELVPRVGEKVKRKPK